jgi:hypothetical protein
MGQEAVDLVRLGDDRQELHLEAATRTDEGVDLQDAPQEPGPRGSPRLAERRVAIVSASAPEGRFAAGSSGAVRVGSVVPDGVQDRLDSGIWRRRCLIVSCSVLGASVGYPRSWPRLGRPRGPGFFSPLRLRRPKTLLEVNGRLLQVW